MTYIAPHINTIIIDVGSEYTKIGFCGDFHPCIVEKSSLLSSADFSETIIKSLERCSTEFGVDSFIVLDNKENSTEIRKRIVQQMFIRKIGSSIFFLKNALCDVFGHGKISGTILSCGAGSLQASTVLNGKLVETYSHSIGSLLVEDYINKNVVELDLKSILNIDNDTNIARSILESVEAINTLKNNHNIDVFELIRPKCYELVDVILNMRSKYYINKKNAANGCIILSGGLFKYKAFLEMLKERILSQLNDNFSDFILYDNDLNCTFLGASLFGSNVCTKPLFISSYDFHSIGIDIVNYKTLEVADN